MHPLTCVAIVLASGCLVLGCGTSSSGAGSPLPSTSAPAPTPPPAAPGPAVPTPTPTPAPAPADDLAPLSDEFDDPASFAAWQRVYVVEQWGFDQLEHADVGATRPGWLTLVPRSSSWYRDYRGVLAFKEVAGDLVVTARVVATDRAGQGAPGRSYSLAGLMLRAPRAVTPATWQPGGEDYVFLSLGAADVPGTFQLEVKTTEDGDSNLQIAQAAGDEAWIRLARVGSAVIALLREAGTPWRVHRRYLRADLPATLQVGMTVYTDWETVSTLSPEAHNTAPILGGTPDLRAQYDFVRFARPDLPATLVGLDLADPSAVTDAQLLAFLGDD